MYVFSCTLYSYGVSDIQKEAFLPETEVKLHDMLPRKCPRRADSAVVCPAVKPRAPENMATEVAFLAFSAEFERNG